MQEAIVKVIGVNGDTVTIAGADSGAEGIHLATDVEGMIDPEIDVVTKSPGSRDGTRYVSHRILERTLIFNVTVLNDENDAWRSRDTRWRKLWSYNRYATIEVSLPGGTPRSLKVRLTEIEVDTEYDPHTNGATDVTMTVVADDPFWYETAFTVSKTFTGSNTFVVSEANPTSNIVFPEWVLEGGTTWTIPDIDNSVDPAKVVYVTLPAFAAGENVVVNTDPGARQLASSTNTPVWGRMNGVRFNSGIQGYTDSLSFTVFHNASSSKTAQLRLKRPYSRPWGGV